MDGADERKLHGAVAAYVFVTHLQLIVRPSFSPSQLSHWARQVLVDGMASIQTALRPAGAALVLSGGEEEEVWQLVQLDDDQVLSTPEQLRSVCSAVAASTHSIAAAVDLKALVGRITNRIAAVFVEQAPDHQHFRALCDTTVIHPAEIWTDDWAVPYMCAWEANGADNTLLCPPVHVWTDAHWEWQSKLKLGAAREAHIPELMLFAYVECFLTPCHELIHICQHLHQLTDSDRTSYSAEHDACRLNLPLLWLVLSGTADDMSWFAAVLMLHSINSGIQSKQELEQVAGVWELYRSWADSFGLESPSAKLQEAFAGESEEEQATKLLQYEEHFKVVVTAESLAAVALSSTAEPTEEHFAGLLGLAFHPQRKGDVYSEDNRALTEIRGTPFALGEQVWERLMSTVQSGLGESASSASLVAHQNHDIKLWGSPPMYPSGVSRESRAPIPGVLGCSGMCRSALNASQTVVPGLMLVADFLSCEEEAAVMDALRAAAAWTTNREQPPRKVLISGPWREGSTFSQNRATSHPQWAREIADRIVVAARLSCDERVHPPLQKLTSHKTGLLYVNEYTEESQFLNFHMDSTKMFDELIIGVSIGAPCHFSFARGSQVVDVLLPPRSAYFMTASARFDFNHGLKAGSLHGPLRISLTYRTIADSALVE